jgi:hypothetical protein
MNRILAAVVLSSCLLFEQYAWAATVIDTTYWKCKVSDGENKDWEGHGDYQVTAINRALEGCKRESRAPSSCKSSKEACEMIVDGQTTRPMWRCMALDEGGTPWYSNIYSEGLDAALAAKDYCRANSALPDTCYVYLFACRNLNTRIP